MNKSKEKVIVFLITGLMVLTPLLQAQEEELSEKWQLYYRYWRDFASCIKGGRAQAHWMADGSSFWYAEGMPDNTVIYKVNPKENTRSELFDVSRLRQALTPMLGHEPLNPGLPFSEFTFVGEGEQAVQFTVEGKEFILTLDTYEITQAPVLSNEEKRRFIPRIARKGVYGFAGEREVLSPDRRWFLTLKDEDLWLRSPLDSREKQLASGGVKYNEWRIRNAKWSPDSRKLAILRMDYRKVRKRPIVHWLEHPAHVELAAHLFTIRPGGPYPQCELVIFDIHSGQEVHVDIGKDPEQFIQIIDWLPDGTELLFFRSNREFTKRDLMTANPTTGSSRVIVSGLNFSVDRGLALEFLEDGKRFIGRRDTHDGWSHLFLFSVEGNLIKQITRGAFHVINVVTVDKKADWIYFAANDDQDRPYDIHFYRVNLEDNSFTRLTDAIGVHSIQFSPSKEFFLDTHSHTVRPPTVELKKANGELLQTLSKANIDALKEELKWVPPEEFVVKAADGKTDLWGLLYKPHDLNPKKKYPVINFVYTNFYPLTPGFGPHYCEEYTKLGFVIFQVWERGSPMRDKEFREVAFGNIGRYEIPDNVAALKQLAEKRPYMDLSRVGIHGGSWGGYASTRALLLAPDVYQVGIAERPYMELYDMAWIELFMGLPENNPEGYEYGSNLRLAKNLKGKLLLEVRTSDISAAFSQTMKMIDAFIRAGKGGHFELMVLPEATHLGPLSPAYRRYVDEARARFYIENLKPDIEK